MQRLGGIIEPEQAQASGVVPRDVINQGRSFYDRARGSIIEDKPDVLFNLFLVSKRARPAFLLEGGNYESAAEMAEIVRTISERYPEFKQFVENSHPLRVLFYIDDLPVSTELLQTGWDHDEWLATNLGFWCKGIPPAEEDRVAIGYWLSRDPDLPGTQIYAEVCKKQNFSEEFFKLKENFWNAMAELIDARWSVGMSLEDLRTLDSWSRLVAQGISDEDLRELIYHELPGYGLEGFAVNLRQGKYSLEDIRRHPEWLLFALSIAEFPTLVRGTPEELEAWNETENEAFSHLAAHPQDAYMALITNPRIWGQYFAHYNEAEYAEMNAILNATMAFYDSLMRRYGYRA